MVKVKEEMDVYCHYCSYKLTLHSYRVYNPGVYNQHYCHKGCYFKYAFGSEWGE